jgi:hypothetical protein
MYSSQVTTNEIGLSRQQTKFNAKCISKPSVDLIEEDAKETRIAASNLQANIELVTISDRIFSDEGNLSVSSSTAALCGSSRESNSIMNYILAMHDEWDSTEKAEFLDWDVISQCTHRVSPLTPETVSEAAASSSRKRSRDRQSLTSQKRTAEKSPTATSLYFPCRASLSLPAEIRSSSTLNRLAQPDRIIHYVEYTCSIKHCGHKYSVSTLLYHFVSRTNYAVTL